MRWNPLTCTAARSCISPARSHAILSYFQPSWSRRTIYTQFASPHLRAKGSISSVLGRRTYQQLSQQPPPTPNSSPPPSSKNPGTTSPSPSTNPPTRPAEREISVREQRRKDWAIIKRLLIHIWPPNDWGVRGRVVFGLGLLLLGKVCHFLNGHVSEKAS
jgi:hypothetical protein